MVRERIEEARAHAANRETEKLAAMVSDDFTASRGLDSRNLETWLSRYYLANRSPKVWMKIREIDADWQTATATILLGTANF
jgi:hypothetical protein